MGGVEVWGGGRRRAQVSRSVGGGPATVRVREGGDVAENGRWVDRRLDEPDREVLAGRAPRLTPDSGVVPRRESHDRESPTRVVSVVPCVLCCSWVPWLALGKTGGLH